MDAGQCEGEQWMQADERKLVEEIISLLEPFNKEGIDLDENTNITSDLQIDSVAVMDFVMELEESLDISIPVNMLSEVQTIGDLAKVVQETTTKDR